LNQYRNNLRLIHDIAESRIKLEKCKRKKQDFTLPTEIPNQVKLKTNKRNIQKIKKPLYQSQEIIEYDENMGVVKLKNNEKRYKINKIKKPRHFVVTESLVPKKI